MCIFNARSASTSSSSAPRAPSRCVELSFSTLRSTPDHPNPKPTPKPPLFSSFHPLTRVIVLPSDVSRLSEHYSRQRSRIGRSAAEGGGSEVGVREKGVGGCITLQERCRVTYRHYNEIGERQSRVYIEYYMTVYLYTIRRNQRYYINIYMTRGARDEFTCE